MTDDADVKNESVMSKTTGRGGKSKDSGKTKGSTKSKAVVDVQKKPFKIVIRKLPVRDFDRCAFTAAISRIASYLSASCVNDSVGAVTAADTEIIQIEHFIEGKLSRKRGPVSGAGFVCIKDEEVLNKFLSLCPSQISFLEDEINNQPDVEMAPNQRILRPVGKVDKLEGTYEEDQEFKNFLLKISQPDIKRPSAEAQLDSKVEAPTIDHKNIPMIKFLREKGEKKIAEKRSLRRTQGAGVGPNASKGGKIGLSKVDKEKEKGGSASNAKNSSSSANGAGLSVLKRTNMASSASSDKSSARTEGGAGSGRSKSSRSSEGFTVAPAPAVGVPVDAALQEAIRRSVNTFREESAASASASAAAASTGPSGSHTHGEKGKASRREKERERSKKKAYDNSDQGGGPSDRQVASEGSGGPKMEKSSGVPPDSGKGGGETKGESKDSFGSKAAAGGGGAGAGGKIGGPRGKKGSWDSSGGTGGVAENGAQHQGGGKEDGPKGKRRGGGKGDKASSGTNSNSNANANANSNSVSAQKPPPMKIMKRTDSAASQSPSV